MEVVICLGSTSVGHLEEDPWKLELPRVRLRHRESGELPPFASDSAALGYWIHLQFIRNVARTAPLLRLVEANERIYLAALDGDYKREKAVQAYTLAAAEFWTNFELDKSLAAAQVTERTVVEYEIGRRFLLYGIRPGAQQSLPEESHVTAIFVHPSVNVFEGDASAWIRMEMSLVRFEMWTSDRFEHARISHAPDAYYENLIDEAQADSCKVRPSLLSLSQPSMTPFSDWELQRLAVAIRQHRKAKVAPREAARSIGESLGPRVPAALGSWSKLVLQGQEQTFAKHVRGHLAKSHQRKTSW